MTLAAYQTLLCRMVASAGWRARLLAHPEQVFAGQPLSAREQRRLLHLAAQPGMRVNTAIHRANRLAPLDQTLPMSCCLLGDRLGPLLDRYWDANPTENLQLPAEAARFAHFAGQALLDGTLADPYLGEVLAFECCCTELRFFGGADLAAAGAPSALPPRLRVLRFRHDPELLLGALSSLQPPPPGLAEGVYFLAIDARHGEPVFRLLDVAVARQLLGAAADADPMA